MNPNKDRLIIGLIIILVIGIPLVLLKTLGIKETARFDWSGFFKSTPMQPEKPSSPAFDSGFATLASEREKSRFLSHYTLRNYQKPNPVLPEEKPHIINESVDIGVIFNMHITDEFYEIDDSGYYCLTANLGKATTSITIGTKTETTEENLELPNRTNGEYDRLRLEQHDNGSIYLISEGRIKIGDNYSNIDIKSEISFIEGDWDTFLSGAKIVMRYTEHSLKDLASLMENVFEKELSSASLAVCEGHCSNFSFTATKISNATITINKKIIHLKYDEPSKIEGSFKVNPVHLLKTIQEAIQHGQ